MIQTTVQIKENWNKISKKYGGYRRDPLPAVRAFLDNVDSELLDIGCGNCITTSRVLKNGFKIRGIDFSKEVLKHTLPGVTKIEADATDIPLKKKFKYIAALGLMHHLPTEKDRLAFLKEVKRLLAKDGQAIITVWYSMKKGDRIKKWGEIERYYYMFSKKELRDLLEKAGFHNFKITLATTVKKKNYIITIIG
jgi:cyclopropane fatty-acyl-phospholipid synthase-like methyltransferase